jgi:hypothetical protein
MDGATPEATRIVTVQRSQIFRAFANGDSAPADRGGFQSRHSQVWSQVQRAISEIERSGGTACETVRWQQYLVLSRIVGQAMQAWDRSQEGVKEFASRTIENSVGNGNPRLSGRTVTQHLRKDAGDVRYLETAMAALKEIRELFCHRRGGGERTEGHVWRARFHA